MAGWSFVASGRSELDERVDFGATQLVAPIERTQLDDEEEGTDGTLLLFDEAASGRRRPTGRQQIVDDDHLLARPDSIDVRLERAGAVFERVFHPVGLVGQLSQLPDRREAQAEPIREGRAEQETA